jgi:hypothetical protein
MELPGEPLLGLIAATAWSTKLAAAARQHGSLSLCR